MKKEELSEEAQEVMHEREILYCTERTRIIAAFMVVLTICGTIAGTCILDAREHTKAEGVKVEAERLETERARYGAEKAMWEHIQPKVEEKK